MKFLQNKRDEPNLILCGNPLPWVDTAKHLGTKIGSNENCILSLDKKEKRALYIQRNNELMQEFSYATSDTKVRINRIFNSHFYGSVIWNLFDQAADMIYNTWNTYQENV